jgi:hypothetical protein
MNFDIREFIALYGNVELLRRDDEQRVSIEGEPVCQVSANTAELNERWVVQRATTSVPFAQSGEKMILVPGFSSVNCSMASNT